MIYLDRPYTQEELEELDLFNEGLEFDSRKEDLIDYSSSPLPSPLPPSYTDLEDWEDKEMKFGKYKGQTLLTVSQDVGYCEWMIKECFHWDTRKDKYLRDMLYGYIAWKEEMKLSHTPLIDNSQLLDRDLSNIDPLSIDVLPWLIEMKPEFAPVSYTDVGKWLLFFELHDLAERWKQVKYFYHRGFLDGVFQIKCSTAQDNPRALEKTSGVIELCCCDSYEQDRIMAVGQNILELLDLGNRTIYYKTDQQSREGTRVNKDRNHIYKLKLE